MVARVPKSTGGQSPIVALHHSVGATVIGAMQKATSGGSAAQRPGRIRVSRCHIASAHRACVIRIAEATTLHRNGHVCATNQ